MVSEQGMRLHLAGATLAAHPGSDGVITRADAELIAARYEATVSELVEAGLWFDTKPGYCIAPVSSPPTGASASREGQRPRAMSGSSSLQQQSDPDLAAAVQIALTSRTDAKAVEVVVVDGVVNLAGRLKTAAEAEKVARVANSIIGVRRVNNWLTSPDETRFTGW